MKQDCNIPLVLQNMQKFPFIEEHILAEEQDKNSRYDEDQQVMVGVDNLPIWMARTKKLMSNAYTRSKTLPSGYTRSGKWKPSKFVPGKMDKRAGK